MFKNFSIFTLINGLKFSKELVKSFFDIFIQMGRSVKLSHTHKKTFKELKKLNCDLDHMKESYIYMEPNHLEVFPFNGLMIENTHRLTDVFPNIVALDSSEESLSNLVRTLENSFCRVNPITFDINNFTPNFNSKFNSVSLNFALDQIQGGTEKVEEFLLKIKDCLSDGSIVFGLTTMGIGLNHKKNALDYIKAKNDKQEWFNLSFAVKDLENILKKHFDSYGIFNIGSCVIFRGIINKKAPDVSKYRPTFESLKGKHLKIQPDDFHKWVKNLDKFKD